MTFLCGVSLINSVHISFFSVMGTLSVSFLLDLLFLQIINLIMDIPGTLWVVYAQFLQ